MEFSSSKNLDIAIGDMLPWLPAAVKLYLEHTERGETIRALARQKGVHASTVLRQVQKTETRRDDPLIDNFLTQMALNWCDQVVPAGDLEESDVPVSDLEGSNGVIGKHALRVLRGLMKEGTLLAITKGVDTAVVLDLREGENPVQLCKAPREVAEILALRDWISGTSSGAVSRYRITPAGRSALNKMMAQAEGKASGCTSESGAFLRPDRAGKNASAASRKRRTVGADTPLRVLARSRSNGQPYLSEDLVQTGDRIQRDFALAQLEASPQSGWSGVMAGLRQVPTGKGSRADRMLDARNRFVAAMDALGPELGEMVLGVCCHEKGMERIEAELNMPARSGKFMLRVALKYLKRHFDQVGGEDHDLIY
ncbi:hypothetical protein SAMN04488527_12320 [Aliiroseovarius crassostreae]|uniref:DUF6456 domain-containing protein n=1 Tax=Aliiroseovarius crassostreae TaxID=154981 RepID=A0A0P7IUI5_9RHOB|nr:DUF6456 domain-containing protein [Aliiroseovarius crassostreae]KPN62448.1 hypothetical protein AKJ29_09500 [Aliiroseovarius crassostreae]SFU85529.1 hypothetical protein SAMN04488527_12320 [Aliiroseovarius crassostreae]